MTKPRNDADVTQESARARLGYSAETGELTWLLPRRLAGQRAGSLTKRGYRVVVLEGRAFFEHRLIWMWVHGAWPCGEIDHINRQKGDNRLANLRDVSKSENAFNAGAHRDNRCGVRGVSPHRGRWKAEVQVNGRRYHVGVFSSAEAAGHAHNEAERLIRAGATSRAADAPRATAEPLTPAEADVVARYRAGQTPTQIANQTGSNMKAVAAIACRARRKGHAVPRHKRLPGSLVKTLSPQEAA